MMSQIPSPLQVRYNDKEAVGNCQVEFYTTGSAVFKGLTVFVLTLVAAILSILLPGLHFITVPLGVVASPFIGGYVFFTSRDAVKRIDGEFLCPKCLAANHVTFRGRPPYHYNCVQCQSGLQITPLLQESAR